MVESEACLSSMGVHPILSLAINRFTRERHFVGTLGCTIGRVGGWYAGG